MNTKIIALLLTLSLVFALAACGSSAPSGGAEDTDPAASDSAESQTVLDKIKAAGKLVVGTVLDDGSYQKAYDEAVALAASLGL